MKIELIDITKIRTNPDNPRIIKDERFEKLKRSLQDFPEMMKLRPIIVDENMVVLGGNMRLKALVDLKVKQTYVVKASDLTEDQKREFIIKDNIGFGEWQWDTLANEWDADKLNEWGLEIPNYLESPEYDELTDENKNQKPSLKITFNNIEHLEQAEKPIADLLRNYQGATYTVAAGEL